MLPKIDQLDGETKALILPLLPRVAAEIAELIGLEAALTLFVGFGGMVWRFTHCPAVMGIGAQRFDEMAGAIGKENALRLAEAFGHDDVYIPVCHAARRALRSRLIIADFDKLTQRVSAREAINQLARRYRLSAKSIESTVNGKTKPTPTKPTGGRT